MDTCYLLVDVQEIRIQPYFCVKQGDYFFHFFVDTLYDFFLSINESFTYPPYKNVTISNVKEIWF